LRSTEYQFTNYLSSRKKIIPPIEIQGRLIEATERERDSRATLLIFNSSVGVNFRLAWVGK